MRVIYGENRRLLAKQLRNEIDAHHAGRPYSRGFLLVPEQQKAGLERQYFAEDSSRSLMLEEVLSFRRFALRLAELGGGAGRKSMSAGLQSFYLGRIMAEESSRLQAFGKAILRPSFLTMISEVIGDFLRYEIQPGQLREAAEAARRDGEPRFAERIGDYAVILEAYLRKMRTAEALPGDLVLGDLAARLERLEERLIEVNQDWSRLTFPWNQYEFLRGSSIWIHGFGISRSLTPQESRITAVLHRLCHEVVLTTECERVPTSLADAAKGPAHFRPGRQLLWSLQEKFSARVESVGGEEGQTRYAFHCFDKTLSEVRWTAGEVRRLLVEEQLQPAQIGIALADPGLALEMQLALRELTIPFYTADVLQDAPGALQRFLSALAHQLRFGWEREHLLPLLRSPYLGLSPEECDQLENFWLSRGMRGDLIWAPERYSVRWQPQTAAPLEAETADEEESGAERAEDTEEQLQTVQEQHLLDRMLALRDQALQGLRDLSTRFQSSRTASEFAQILLAFLSGIDLGSKLEIYRDRLLTEGLRDEAELEAKTWNHCLRLLGEFSGVDDAALLPPEDFLYYFEEALDVTSRQRIPANGNQVLMGGLNQLAQENVDYLFVLAADAGHLPGKGFSAGLLTAPDRDRINHYLGNHLDTLLPASEEQRMYASESHLYSLFDLPARLVSLSFTGTPAQAAPVFEALRAAQTGNLAEHRGPLSLRDPLWAEPVRAWSMLSSPGRRDLLRDTDAGQADLHDLRDYLAKHHPSVLTLWENKTSLREISGDGTLRLDSGLVDRLLGDAPVWSVSQLERYSSCPFSFFANYLLRLRRREEWLPEAAGFGTLLHAVMEVQQKDWQEQLEITRPEDYPALFRRLAEELDSQKLSNYFALAKALDPSLSLFWERGQAFGSRYKALGVALVSTAAQLREFAEGDLPWVPYMEEWSFGPESGNAFIAAYNESERMYFRGRIDRVDAARVGEGPDLVRMIDYKSGMKRVSYPDLFYGIDLQLPLYLSAFEDLNKGEYVARDAAYAPLLKPSFRAPETEQPTEEVLAKDREKKLRFSSIDLEPDSLHRLMRHSLTKAFELVTAMRGGELSASPRSTDAGKSPCQYCDFRALCRLDRGEFRVRQEKPLSQVWAELETQDNQDSSAVPKKSKDYLAAILAAGETEYDNE